MPLFQNEVGKRIYVWTRAKGAPSPGVRRCVISSHGGQAKVNGMNKVPGTIKLVYYCPHGSVLDQRGFGNIAKNILVPDSEIAANQSQDYELTKLQGDPDAETYETIRNSEELVANEREAITRTLLKLIEEESSAEEKYGSQHKVTQSYKKAFDKASRTYGFLGDEVDVVTIRRRKLYRPPLLSDVILEMNKAGYRYPEIHCVFCRCPPEGGPSHKPAYRTDEV